LGHPEFHDVKSDIKQPHSGASIIKLIYLSMF
jgi:hypothetical protein